VLLQAGQTAPALADMDEAIRLVPVNPRYHLRRLQILCDVKRTQDAVRELKTLNQMNYDAKALSEAQHQQLESLRTRLAGVADAGNH
jgi:hypothetical protein